MFNLRRTNAIFAVVISWAVGCTANGLHDSSAGLRFEKRNEVNVIPSVMDSSVHTWDLFWGSPLKDIQKHTIGSTYFFISIYNFR